MKSLHKNESKPLAYIIEEQLQLRSKLMIYLNKLAGTYPPIADPNIPEKSLEQNLEEFLQCLNDYLCLGHFEIYPIIEEKLNELKDTSASAKNALFAERLYANKDKILDISDKLSALLYRER